VVSSSYLPIGIAVWGKETDYNIFPDSVSLKAAWSNGTDKHSVCGYLDFEDPANGDFRLKNNAVAFTAGFKNFAMDSFGVVSPQLKTLAKKPTLPIVIALDKTNDNPVMDFIGAKVKNLITLGERSATGMNDTTGVLVVAVIPGSAAAKSLQANDVIISFNNKKVNKLRDLLEARMSVIGSGTEALIFRNQKEIKVPIELN
jgi:hypothetical protein